jgi:Tfp pilus assembly protein PilN
MINLLPRETKQQIRAARLNVVLVRYIVFLLISIVFVSGASVATYVYLNTQEETARRLAEIHSTSNTPDSITEQEAAEFRQQLNQIQSVVSQTPSYYSGLLNLTRNLPDGVILTSIDLDSQKLTDPIVFDAIAKSTEVALTIEHGLNQSPQLFSGFTIQSMTNDSGDTEYPVNVRFSIMMSGDTFR